MVVSPCCVGNRKGAGSKYGVDARHCVPMRGEKTFSIVLLLHSPFVFKLGEAKLAQLKARGSSSKATITHKYRLRSSVKSFLIGDLFVLIGVIGLAIEFVLGKTPRVEPQRAFPLSTSSNATQTRASFLRNLISYSYNITGNYNRKFSR